MKTLAELNKKCTLLCEHKQPAFIVEGFDKSTMFEGNPTTCKLFTDNDGTYYIYKRITNAEIHVYTDYSSAINKYINFIKNTCNAI